jgi:hypothetical protein
MGIEWFNVDLACYYGYDALRVEDTYYIYYA